MRVTSILLYVCLDTSPLTFIDGAQSKDILDILNCEKKQTNFQKKTEISRQKRPLSNKPKPKTEFGKNVF